MSKIYYNIDEIKEEFKKENKYFNKKLEDYVFRIRLFNRMNKIYFSRTPESDSLYRRRNRLIIIVISGVFYIKTQNAIFNRLEIKLLAGKNPIGKFLIPFSKTFYFIGCLFFAQLCIKYLYYLNKVFKSYQFALESVLKYKIISNEYTYMGDYEELDKFDILDTENIKKNQ